MSRIRWPRYASVLGIAVLAMGCAAPGNPQEGHLLAFQAPEGLAIVAIDGGGPRGFDAGGRQNPHHPDWAPSGEWLAFVADEGDGTSDIWIARPDGTDARKLVDCRPPCAMAEDPAWSPEESRIAYWTNGEDQPQSIGVVDVESGDVLVTVPGPIVEPRWSPDGSRLVVAVARLDPVTDEETGSAIATIDVTADDASLTPITPETMTGSYPDWSWENDLIVFQSGSGAPFESTGEPPNLYTVRPDGSELTALTDREADEPRVALPAWMPGSGLILLTMIHTTERFTLATMSPDGDVTELQDGDGSPIVGAHARVPAR